MKFKKYITLREFDLISYGDKTTWMNTLIKAHKGAGSIIFTWLPTEKGFIWARRLSKSMWVNGKKVQRPVSVVTHDEMIEGGEDQFQPFPQKKRMRGRITDSGEVVVYDQTNYNDRDLDKMMDQIYKHIKGQ